MFVIEYLKLLVTLLEMTREKSGITLQKFVELKS